MNGLAFACIMCTLCTCENSENQLFGEHLDPSEPLELSLEPDLGYPPPDPLFKTTVPALK